MFTGQTVSQDEQIDLKAETDAATPGAASDKTQTIMQVAGAGTSISDIERGQWEEERLKLYQQLDDKVCKQRILAIQSRSHH